MCNCGNGCTRKGEGCDGTIPLSEALAAIDRGEVVEAQFMDEGAWNKLSRDYRVAIGCLTQPSTRFRLAPPSRLKALVDDHRRNWQSNCREDDDERLAQAVTRDIITYLHNETSGDGSSWARAAESISRAYLGSK